MSGDLRAAQRVAPWELCWASRTAALMVASKDGHSGDSTAVS